MSKKNRWYVLRPLKLNSGKEVPWGTFLTKAEEKTLPENVHRVLVRGVILHDMDGEIDIPWRERNKCNLRLRCLEEIGTPEAKRIMAQILRKQAEERGLEFSGPNEASIKKQTEDLAERKEAEAKAEEAEEAEEVVDDASDLLDVLGEEEAEVEKPKSKKKTASKTRRRKKKA